MIEWKHKSEHQKIERKEKNKRESLNIPRHATREEWNKRLSGLASVRLRTWTKLLRNNKKKKWESNDRNGRKRSQQPVWDVIKPLSRYFLTLLHLKYLACECFKDYRSLTVLLMFRNTIYAWTLSVFSPWECGGVEFSVKGHYITNVKSRVI